MTQIFESFEDFYNAINEAKGKQIKSKQHGNLNLVEEYKGMYIVTGLDTPTVIEVYDKDADTLFIVGMDDSKASGKREFSDAEVQDAKNYIDWRTKKKK